MGAHDDQEAIRRALEGAAPFVVSALRAEGIADRYAAALVWPRGELPRIEIIAVDTTRKPVAR